MIAARGSGPHLRDPNWYRVRYALAVQCLEMATMSNETPSPSKKESRFRRRRNRAERSEDPGWPKEIHAEDGAWRNEFGEVTADTLGELYRNRTPGKEHFDQAATAAKEEAEELVASAAEILEGAGWQWIGRKPPRFVRWKRALSPRRITRRRPVPDSELILFLSWVVEPASVVLLFSAWLVEEENGDFLGEADFPLAALKQAIAGPREPESLEPLDRRNRIGDGEAEMINPSWLIAYLARLVYDWPRDVRGARTQARLGRTQLRRPREPSFRVQYNLACLFSRLIRVAEQRSDREGASQFVSIAAGQLERALFRLPDEQRDRLAKWAEEDPGLATLRDRREAEFAEIIARWGAGDKQERRLDDPVLVQRIKYDPGSEILDVYFLDGVKKQYGGVPQKAIDALFGPIHDADQGDEHEVRKAREEAFVKTVERDYPPIRP